MKFRDTLTPASRLRYLAWRSLGTKGLIEVSLNNGLKLELRGRDEQGDYGDKDILDASIAWEIFGEEWYEHPYLQELSPNCSVVDVGGNVGFSCLLWANKFPASKIITFEPHPRHVKQIQRNIALNNLGDRVTVVPKAAGVAEGQMFLTDAGPASEVLSQKATSAIPVGIADFFASIGDRNVDLLKMDIEGGEYPIMADPRFDKLDARVAVIEWHGNADYPDEEGRTWIRQRLENLGYTVEVGKPDRPESRMLWAKRGL